MDSMWVSGTQDLGSIPGGATNKHKNTRAQRGCFVSDRTRKKQAFLSGRGETKPAAGRQMAFLYFQHEPLSGTASEAKLSPGHKVTLKVVRKSALQQEGNKTSCRKVDGVFVFSTRATLRNSERSEAISWPLHL